MPPTLPTWPSGRRSPVLELACDISDLESRFGITFTKLQDDLDWFLGAHIFHKKLGLVVFIKYDGLPGGGTIVYVDSAVAEATQDSHSFIGELGLPETWVTWRVNAKT